MGRGYKGFIWFAALVLFAGLAHAAEMDLEAEKRSLLPLIPESTYTYSWSFKASKSTTTLTLKTARAAGTDVFYFAAEKDLKTGATALPNPLISNTSIGSGVFIKKPDGIATANCYSKNDIYSIPKTALDQAVVVLKSAPETGAVSEVETADKEMKHVYKIMGKEDVTVPAGAFKDCVKIQIDEVFPKTPAENNTATAWLAPGVGLVKWIRGTGRVDELAAYTLGTAKK